MCVIHTYIVNTMHHCHVNIKITLLKQKEISIEYVIITVSVCAQGSSPLHHVKRSCEETRFVNQVSASSSGAWPGLS